MRLLLYNLIVLLLHTIVLTNCTCGAKLDLDLDDMGNHPIAIVVGMPKAGTSSIRDYFKCGNMKAKHWSCNEAGEERSMCAACMRNNYLQGKDPFDHCGNGVQVYAQMDDPNKNTKLCYFPQIEMLEYIHQWYPDITFILNQRNTSDWINSLAHWNAMDKRIQACDITGLPAGVGTHEELVAWYYRHEQDIHDFVSKYPSHALVKVHIDDQEAGAALEAAFGISRSCYGHSNGKVHQGEAVHGHEPRVEDSPQLDIHEGATMPSLDEHHQIEQHSKMEEQKNHESLHHKNNSLSGLVGWYAEQSAVPIYVYPTPAYDACIEQHYHKVDNYKHAKHGGEIWFAEEMKRSPWRVFDPQEATLFIIPLYYGLQTNTRKNICAKDMKNALNEIKESEWYKKLDGRDHVMLSTDYASYFQPAITAACPHCILLLQEHGVRHQTTSYCQIGAPMNTGRYDYEQLLPLEVMTEDEDEFYSRKHIYWFAGQAQEPKPYYVRRKLEKSYKLLNMTFVVTFSNEADFNEHCGVDYECVSDHLAKDTVTHGNYTYHMRNTQLGMHIVGDRPGSSHIWDIIRAGSVLSVVSNEWYTVGYPFYHVPWLDLTFRIDETRTEEELASDMQAIMNMDKSLVFARRQELMKYRYMLLYEIPDSCVGHALILDAVDHCL